MMTKQQLKMKKEHCYPWSPNRFLFLTFAHDWVYKMHSRFYPVRREQFDVIHYAGMTFYKICIFTFFIVPYLALRIVS